MGNIIGYANELRYIGHMGYQISNLTIKELKRNIKVRKYTFLMYLLPKKAFIYKHIYISLHNVLDFMTNIKILVYSFKNLHGNCRMIVSGT